MDLAALVSISDAPGSSIDQISQRTGIELRLLRRMLARLSESSLVITRADKGQYLSAKGEHTVRALIPIVRDIQGRILAPLSEAERAMLRDLMTRVVTANT
jgi:DNA-binding MarR family transcriptional regulator